MAIACFAQQVLKAIGDQDGGLSKAFELTKVQPEVQELFKKEGVETLVDFVGYFTRQVYEGEADLTIEKIESMAGNQVAVSRLRAAVQVAQSVKDQPVEKSGSSPGVDLEAPLDEKDTKDMRSEWHRRYNLQLTLYLSPAEPLVNRLWRELRRNVLFFVAYGEDKIHFSI